MKTNILLSYFPFSVGIKVKHVKCFKSVFRKFYGEQLKGPLFLAAVEAWLEGRQWQSVGVCDYILATLQRIPVSFCTWINGP